MFQDKITTYIHANLPGYIYKCLTEAGSMNLELFLAVCLVTSQVSAHASDWDRFTFAQEWPQTTCMLGKKEKKTCVIPPSITSFVIHGLWPSSGSSEGPTNCSGPAFNMDTIKNLTSELNNSWPNLYTNTPLIDFWRHEWEAHGRCALTLKTTGTEYLFFRKTLDIMAKFNISRSLNQANVIPDDSKLYSVNNVMAALNKILGVKTNLQCFSSSYENIRAGKHQYLAEIRICMTKTFQLISCTDNENTNVYFKSKKKAYTEPCRGKFTFPQIKRNLLYDYNL